MELCSLTCDCDVLFWSKCNVVTKRAQGGGGGGGGVGGGGGGGDWHGAFKDAHKCV